ncbi:hypothetical protein BH09PAT3_BH09PAT3_0100 [soil metagenome]
MSKLSVIAATVAILPALAFSSPASAAALGQFESGDIYYGRNVTKSQPFALGDVNAICGETVQLRVMLHNGGPTPVSNVTVTATLPSEKATSFTSRATISSPNADPSSTSDTVTVKSDKAATLSYVNGTTELVAAHNNTVLQTLPDTITSTGVKLPDTINVSVDEKRYVQFEAKLNCDTPPVVKQIQVCEISTKKLVTINESDFNSTKYTKDLSKCNVTPVTSAATLTKTGAGDVAAIFAAAAAFGAVAYSFVMRRQNAR